MEKKNKFYLSKGKEITDIYPGRTWASGKNEQTSDMRINSTFEINVQGFSRFTTDKAFETASKTTIYLFDRSKKIIRYLQLQSSKIDIELPKNVAFVAVEIVFTEVYSGRGDYEYSRLVEIHPHYKSISKEYKKESNYLFFRESISGKIVLFGSDYLLVKNASIEDELLFIIYKNNKAYSISQFNKTDCRFDHCKCSVELRLTPSDKYSKILNSIKKKYDLIKLAVGKTAVELRKRCIIQLYIQGESVITNYAGGTYWEDEVIEAVDNESALSTKYNFAKGPRFSEVSLLGFNYDINSVYKCVEGQNIWNGTSSSIVGGQKHRFPCSIKFTKVHSKGDEIRFSDRDNIKLMSDGKSSGLDKKQVGEAVIYRCKYDSYKIEIFTGFDGTGTAIYKSNYLYGNDSKFIITNGAGLYKMTSIEQAFPLKKPEPSTFNLGENVINYQLWGRLLCDVETSADGQKLYDLGYDDFATERANYKKCIGLKFSEGENKLVHFRQSQETQEQPTPFGLTEYGEYFVQPIIPGSLAYRVYAYPLAKSTWGNTSLWVGFEESREFHGIVGMENWAKKFYKKITHRDCMEVGAVIKVLLNEIDSSIKFDTTPEYSEFLYGQKQEGDKFEGLQVYITQKSNVLKGEYDQAAQKAEITLEQLMNMLKDCFRCYWYIDSENRFRVEHIRYFMNGYSYGKPVSQLNITKKYDKFNKKQISYCQQEVSFSKSDLKSRYEFSWADEVTDAMGGSFYADIKSKYIQQDETENITVEPFTSDIDYMMFAPQKFSQDGFALIITRFGEVPIVYHEFYDKRNTLVPMRFHTQNYYASFVYLFNFYMYDMPSAKISTSIDRDGSIYSVSGIKRCMTHTVEIQPSFSLDINKLITTDVGDGYIDNIAIDLDTELAKITLAYEPK